MKKTHLQWVLRIEEFPYGQVVLCPGKRAFASPKKAVVLLGQCGLSPFSAKLSLSLRVSLRKGRKIESERFAPGAFCIRRLLFHPGNEKSGLNGQLLNGEGLKF